MQYTIENEYFVVGIDSKGAELCSIRSKKTGTEFVWQADPAVWGRHAPMLFPIIGRLKGQVYTVQSKEYAITQHGFARDSEFECISHGMQSISFVLRPSPSTRQMYPFEFALTVRYTLNGKTLTKEHIVANHGEETMYYEMGSHDGYCIALAEGETMADYFIDFGEQDALHPILWESVNGSLMMSDRRGKLPLADGKLPVDMALFDPDALVLDEIEPRRVSVRSTKSPYTLTFEYADFPYLGIWTKHMDTDTNYICLEAWSTLPDATFLDYALEKKQDICVLNAGETTTLTFSTTISE